MRLTKLFLCVIFGVMFFTSCEYSSFMSASSTSNEVMVVIDDNVWENESGRVLFNVLNSPAKGLPQTEPNFRIIQITPENFTSTFKMARNIIIPEISNIYTQSKITSETDKYATGQILMTIKAPDSTSFIKYVNENKDVIVDYILQKEMERTADWLIKDSGTPQSHIKQVFDINIHYPKGISNVSERENFYWATNNATRARKDIVIYQVPYTNENMFQKDSLIALRNRVLGKNITGSFESQMRTAAKAYDPDYKTMNVNGLYRAELRGLWDMSKDMMGGPFVMHAFVNPHTNMFVVVEVFVFAPEKNKRNLIRGLEAALYTIKIPQPQQDK